MKATIDGIACEGTPEEICEFKKLRDAINQDKLWDSLDRQARGIVKEQMQKVIDDVTNITGKKPIVFGSY